MPLLDVMLLLGVAAAGLLLGRMAGVPSVVVYLVAGVAVGPGVLGWVHHSHDLEQLAELGVALLLFGVGIEFSLERLHRILVPMLASGSLQLAGTAIAAALGFSLLGFDASVSVFIGMLLSLSSTAIVFKLYGEADEIDAPQGQAAAGILLFQDLALVPMVLMIPLLAGLGGDGALGAFTALLSALGAIAALLLGAWVVLPRTLELVAKARTPELFPIAALVIAFGTAAGAAALGLSLPIGAFLAGLVLSRSPYAHQVFSEIIPLRDAFVAIFFTSIGALVEPAALAADPGLALAMLLAALVKGAITMGVVAAVWRSARVALLTGFGLAQIGEFSFVLAREAVAVGLIGERLEQAFLGAAIVSMAATPYLMKLARRLALVEPAGRDAAASRLRDHVLLLGYGETGRAIARVLRETGVPFEALDLVSAHVAEGRREGVPIHFGDVGRRPVLETHGAARARAVMIALGDPVSTRRCVSLVRQLSPRARILVRVQSADEIGELERLGADDVIPAKLETSVELLARLLQSLGVPRHIVRLQEATIRLDHYRAMRQAGSVPELLSHVQDLLTGGALETARLSAASRANGRSLAELELPRRAGAQVLSVLREGAPLPGPSGETRLQADDALVLYGSPESIDSALEILDAASGPDAPR